MLEVTRTIAIPDEELSFEFVASSGPGGQNVNKVATAAVLRFDAAGSPSLPGPVKERLRALAGSRMSAEGVVLIKAQRYRSQERNRADALARLAALLAAAAVPPRPRTPTRPTRASKERRLQAKSQRSATKRLRGRPLD
jgi:ribosome-associated protein